jgi:hypothetical protein
MPNEHRTVTWPVNTPLRGGVGRRRGAASFNKPLYFTRDYVLTYDDRDTPTHYAFKVANWTDAVAREYERAQEMSAEASKAAPAERVSTAKPGLVAEVKSVVAAQDARGRWIEKGALQYHGAEERTIRVIRCATFIRNVETLSHYLASTRP